MIIALALSTGASSQTGEMLREEFHQTYPLSAQGRVSLENINGAVRINAWDHNEVRVDAVKSAYRRDRLDEAKIIVEAGSDAVRIRTDYPEQDQNFTTDRQGRLNNPAQVEYTLTIPRHARVESVELINGGLEIEGVAGDVSASSINGPVRARGLVGQAKLSTINGPLEATFDRLDESHPITLNSVNGPVTLTLPSDTNAQVRASTVHGGISNDFGLPVRKGEYVGHDLSGTLGQGGPRIKLGNVNGSITLRHAQDGRPLSRATSLLSERGKDKDREMELEDRELEREVRSAASEVQREARRAERDAARARLDNEREALRNTVAIEREAAREAQRALQESKEEMKRQAREQTRNYGGGSNSSRFIEREQKSFPVSGSPRITLNTFDGQIIVRAYDKQEVSFTAVKRASSEQAMRAINMQAQQNGSNVQITASFDEAQARRGSDGVNANDANVTLEVFVPRNASLTASSGDGRISVEGLRGELQLRTGDGTIDVRDSGGRLVADTGDGRIHLTNFDGEANVRTGDGGLTLEGRFTQLNALTGDGPIMLSVPSDLSATVETDAEDVVNEGLAILEEPGSAAAGQRRWRIGQGGSVFKLHTGDGRVYLRRAN
jgi:DUF4097 and DUF4098 domain-containing protein YvlB